MKVYKFDKFNLLSFNQFYHQLRNGFTLGLISGTADAESGY